MANEICLERSLGTSFWQDQEGPDAFDGRSKQGKQRNFFIGRIDVTEHSDSAELRVSVKVSFLGRVDLAWESPEKVAFERAKSNLGLGIWIGLEGDEASGALNASV
jgi:hypothetical protein